MYYKKSIQFTNFHYIANRSNNSLKYSNKIPFEINKIIFLSLEAQALLFRIVKTDRDDEICSDLCLNSISDELFLIQNTEKKYTIALT